MVHDALRRIGRLIRDMQESHSHCAVVVDEHGTATGLAFLEDALEEIVGPIYDEFDVASVPSTGQADGSIEMAGDIALPAAEEILSLRETGEFDTIGGLVAAELGHLPEEGNELEIGRYRVTVLSVRKNRVERLRFVRN